MVTLKDLLVLVVVYVYVFAVIGVGEGLRRWRRLEPEFTRKMIHFFAGDAILFCPFFDTPQLIPVVPLTLGLLIFFTTPRSPFKSLRSMFEVMARKEDYATGHIYGPFYYIVSVGIVVAAFALPFGAAYWPLFTLGAFALFSMFYGDGLAAIVGTRWGRRKYAIRGNMRSLEGSITVFVMSIVSAVITFMYYSYFGFWPSLGMLHPRLLTAALFGIPVTLLLTLASLSASIYTSLVTLAIVGSLLASVVEALSPRGVDNLTLPLLLTPLFVLLAYFASPWYFALLQLPPLL
ncbi:MAG: hypothetical protein KIH01_02520 [Candidatus Freyarchaeota archaeon]|nr:hypothetical protein [Candidatus Jordarchaeia archaeon]